MPNTSQSKATTLALGISINKAYDLMTGDEDARVCKDIPEQACRHQPRNALAYMFANLVNKIADELTSAKLILPWLLSAMGASAVFTSFLVPIREAGVLLPQLVVAAYIRRLPVRKTVWIWGAASSAVSLLLMAFAIHYFEGNQAAWIIILALVVFSLARGLCSVSAKDVLGKTVSKGSRGSIMGFSAGLAGVITLVFGIYVQWYGSQVPTVSLITQLFLMSTLLWLLALVSFASIREIPGSVEGGGNAISVAIQSLTLVKTDAQLRIFIQLRIFLLSIALAPPFYVMLAQQYTGDITNLGLLIIASGVANSVSAPIWGRMGDRSSKRVMRIAATIAGLLGIFVFMLAVNNVAWLSNPLFHASAYMILIIVHSGVRLGRKIYLVDLATTENRATYVAVSNTILGIAMLVAGIVGVIADILAVHYVLLLLAVTSCLAALITIRLPEVSQGQ